MVVSITGVPGDQAGDQPRAFIAAFTSSAERTAFTPEAVPSTPKPAGPNASAAAISPPAITIRLHATGLVRHQLSAGGTVRLVAAAAAPNVAPVILLLTLASLFAFTWICCEVGCEIPFFP